jgi:ubiquinone/menaquinone biosynthesis C-methylase UbiE
MLEDPTLRVARGYDEIAEKYATWGGHEPRGAKREYLDQAKRRISPGSRVLDLGCGTGAQVTRYLAEVASTVGVDVSKRSLSIAARAVPRADFVCADMGSVSFAPASFHGVVAFFSLIHVPRERHGEVLLGIRSWLKPGGFLIVTMAAGAGVLSSDEDRFLGVPMYWSGWDAVTNRNLVEASGLVIESVQDHTEIEDGVQVTHRWIVARLDE